MAGFAVLLRKYSVVRFFPPRFGKPSARANAAESSPAALAAWRDLLYLAPEDPEVHLGLAFTLLRIHRVKDARRHFRAVLRYLGSLGDEEHLPGPDGLKVGWVRAACQSLAKDGYPGRTV